MSDTAELKVAVVAEPNVVEKKSEAADSDNYWKSIMAPAPPASVVATAEDYKAVGPAAGVVAAVNNYFRIKDRGSTFYVEFYGGMTTFFSMCYILFLNGLIIRGTGITAGGSFFATALASGIFTFLMGLLVNAPIALAPGMGLNAYFATIAALGTGKLDYANALGAVFLSGVFYTFFTFTGLRTAIFKAIPSHLRTAISVGVGFFITIVGLRIGGIFSTTGVIDFVGNGNARIAALGLTFMILFSTLKTPGAVILSIILTTFVGLNYGVGTETLGSSNLNTPGAVTSLQYAAGAGWFNSVNMDWLPVMSNIPSGKLRFDQANTPIFWEAVWTFLAVEMFDSFGTITATVEKAGLMTGVNGKQLVNRAMGMDGFGLMLGAVIGSNSITCYIESLTGIEAGARTGFASIVTGSAFLLSLLFVWPFVSIIPGCATTMALVYVGVCSMQSLTAKGGDIDFNDPLHLWTTFLSVAIMGFTYSIFNGICFSFLAYAFIKIVRAGGNYFAERPSHVQFVLKAAACSLAFAGALADYVAKTDSKLYGKFLDIANTEQKATITAGFAFMLIGALTSLIGFVYSGLSVQNIMASGETFAKKNVYLAINAFALLSVFIGTVLPCNASGMSCAKLQPIYGPAWGCSIAAIVVNAIALAHVVFGYESSAKFIKPAAGTDVSLPHPVMVVLCIFFVFRFRYLGA